jgi:hypothetical protein
VCSTQKVDRIMFLKMKVLFAILQLLLVVPCSAGTIEVKPGPGTFVHYENKIQVEVAQRGSPFVGNSEIPVTTLRYNNFGYKYGPSSLIYQQPIDAGDIYIQLTSNCSESETDFVLDISFQELSFQQQSVHINIAVDPPTISSPSQDLDATTFSRSELVRCCLELHILLLWCSREYW